nr:hypothetical protein [uncultured Blautia sp.]
MADRLSEGSESVALASGEKISSAFAASSGTAEKSAAETNPADCVSRHADNKNARVFFFIYILLLKRMIFIIRL